MRILAWVEEATWPAVISATRQLADGRDAQITLIHVVERDSQEAAASAFGGLMGRGRRRDPGQTIGALSVEAAQRLVQDALANLGRDATTRVEEGLPERIVTAAADEADYIVLARNGDRSRLGPKSLVKHTRFVVDHSPCQVVLVWPESAPDLGSIPPPPPDR